MANNARETIWVKDPEYGQPIALVKTVQAPGETLADCQAWKWKDGGWIQDDDCALDIYASTGYDWWKIDEVIPKMTLDQAIKGVEDWQKGIRYDK